METITNSLTEYYIRKNIIPCDKKEIFAYGFKLIIADIINFSIVILLSLIINRLLDGLVFLITLCSIRQFSGGFHANTFWMCRLSMIITFCCVITISSLLANNINVIIIIIINTVCITVIGTLSPIKHTNKSLTAQQQQKNKRNAIIISLIFFVISSALAIMGIYEGITISITLTAVVVLMIIGIAAQKGGNGNVGLAQ